MVSKHQTALAERMDKVNLLWKRLEGQLRAIGCPQPVSVVIEQDADGFYSSLRFEKQNGQWGIFYCFSEFGAESLSSSKRIEECSAEDRLMLIDYAPALKAEAQASLNRFIAKADESICKFEWMLDLEGI